MRLYCLLLTGIYTIQRQLATGFQGFQAVVEGHSYSEWLDDGEISVLKCRRCGNQSAGFNDQSSLVKSPQSKLKDKDG